MTDKTGFSKCGMVADRGAGMRQASDLLAFFAIGFFVTFVLLVFA